MFTHFIRGKSVCGVLCAALAFTAAYAQGAQVATPVFSPPAGVYDAPPTVAITTATAGASIRFTTNGKNPTKTSGTLYTKPGVVTKTVTVKAFAYKTGWTSSAVATAKYTLLVAVPTFSPPAGTYRSAQTVTMSTATAGASIGYTTDGTVPTWTTGTLYKGPVTVSQSQILTAIAFKTGWTPSSPAAASYTIDTVAPTVIGESPASDAAEVAILTKVKASFSEAMDPSTLTPSTFTLTGPSGEVTGAVGYAGTTATFTPAAALEHSTTYTATVTEEAKDLVGNPLAAPVSWSFATTAPPAYTDPLTGMELMWVPAGTFEMGDIFGGGDYDEVPVHAVTLTKGFFMGRYEVTQGQWQTVMGTNPSYFVSCGANCPVEQVSWYDAQDFVAALSSQTGKAYRLPTEAEWEHAASYGPPKQKYAGTSDDAAVGNYAWHWSNSGVATHAVGTKLPNSLGLYDLSGNVWEWTQDWYDAEYYHVSPSTDPPGPASGEWRVMRGGSFWNDLWYARSALRWGYWIDATDYFLGLRVVLPQ